MTFKQLKTELSGQHLHLFKGTTQAENSIEVSYYGENYKVWKAIS
jgi:hypothetical protein